MALTLAEARKSKDFGFPVVLRRKNTEWEGFIVEVAEKCVLMVGHQKNNGAADHCLGWVGLENLYVLESKDSW